MLSVVVVARHLPVALALVRLTLLRLVTLTHPDRTQGISAVEENAGAGTLAPGHSTGVELDALDREGALQYLGIDLQLPATASDELATAD